MFARESDMTAHVSRWMREKELAVKSEFCTPWGICDLVGLSFNKRHFEHRLRCGQTKAIGSITRTALLLDIPDMEKDKATTFEQLVQLTSPTIPEEQLRKELERLIADKFVVADSHGMLQKKNGWMPLHKRLVAVELKLLRIEEAMLQALNNLGFASESYVGLPADVAKRIKDKESRWARFFDAGVGLLSVSPEGCRVLKRASTSEKYLNKAIQFHTVEKFWRTRPRGS